MTVSMFDSYLERMPLHRTERMMDMGQAAIYAQLTTDARRRMWNGWSNLVSKINTLMIMTDAGKIGMNPITWNGQQLSIQQLVKKFTQTWGKRSVIS